jgi:hypothetical protein
MDRTSLLAVTALTIWGVARAATEAARVWYIHAIR